MQYRFTEGDLVRLKSGGPVMVVRFPVEHVLLCAWTDHAGRARRGTFSPAQLQPVKPAHPVWITATARLAARWPVVAPVC